MTVSHKFKRTRRWMPCQPFRRSRKLSACCPVANIRLRLDSSLDRQSLWQAADWETPSTLPSHMTAWDSKDASTFHLYKRKGNRRACENLRGISLLSTAGKTLARVLVSPVTAHLERVFLPKGLCGSRKIAALSTWCLLPGSLKKSVCNRTHWPVLYLCRSDQGLRQC